MIDICLDHNKVIRALVEDGTEILIQSTKQYITITHVNEQGKPSDTITIFKEKNKSYS